MPPAGISSAIVDAAAPLQLGLLHLFVHSEHNRGRSYAELPMGVARSVQVRRRLQASREGRWNMGRWGEAERSYEIVLDRIWWGNMMNTRSHLGECELGRTRARRTSVADR